MRDLPAKILIFAAILVALLSVHIFLQTRSDSPRSEADSQFSPMDAQKSSAVTSVIHTNKNEERMMRLPINPLTDPQIEEDDLRYALQLADGGDREMALMLSRYREKLDKAIFQREVAELARQQPSSDPLRAEAYIRLDEKVAAREVSEASLAIKQMVRHRRIHSVQPKI